MSDLLILEWSRDHLSALVLADGGKGSVRAAASAPFVDHADEQIPVSQGAEALRAWLNKEGITAEQTVIVVPRDAVIIRRLQIPVAPADELPDLVRFQAATRTSTPINALSLDFLTLPVLNPDAGQEVISCTIERDALTRIQSVCQGARLQLERVTVSSLTVAELVRTKAASDLGLQQPDLIVYQHGRRVEFSIFDFGTLVFSHASLLPEPVEGGTPADRLKSFKSDLSRCLVALSQSNPNATLGRCFYVSGVRDEDVLQQLEQKFPGAITEVNASATLSGKPIPGYESLLGAGLPARDDRLHVDLLHPRQRKEVPDRRKLYYGVSAAAALLVFILGYWVFYSKKSALEESILTLQTDVNSKSELLKKGKPRADAYQRLARWKELDSDPVELWNQLRVRLTGTDRVYFVEMRVVPQGGEMQARFVGRGCAKTRGDVDGLNQTLSDNGFRVRPTTPKQGSRDPDYPWEFDLDVELPRPQPVKPVVGKPDSSGMQTTAAAPQRS
ncbi:hypothetical protein SH661x_004447 [Planctomicrobium sp. SH661]|uniref:hypothetical protein n=1 Tax=Planctomicrobium sp. SH661 TaxID=3448124 RepID=UPI003F5B6830